VPGNSHRIGGFALVALISLLLPTVAAAKTFEPTRKDDPAPNGCKPNNCSLREALIAAGSHDGPDTVALRKGTYAVIGGVNLLAQTRLVGQGPGKTTIQGNETERMVTSSGGVVRDLEITGGATSGDGGGIGHFPSTHLTVDHVLIDGNTAHAGGGIYATDGEVTVKNSTIAGNAASFGGGIDSKANQLTLIKTTVTINQAAEGAGIDLRPNDHAVGAELRGSTISGNISSHKAAGILADGNPYPGGEDGPTEPDLFVFNSTIAGNQAANDAGGIMGDNAASVTLDNATVGFNRANADNVGTAVAGGVWQHSGAAFIVDDSLLASNSLGQGGSDAECSGSFNGTGNVLNAVAGCTSFSNADNRIVATQIASALADNGGPTETMRVPIGSPAIGFANTCPKRDQRGKLRPNNCDSGAYENKPKR
jgi:hypothetical protein